MAFGTNDEIIFGSQDEEVEVDSGTFGKRDELLPSTAFKHAVPEVVNGEVVRPPKAEPRPRKPGREALGEGLVGIGETARSLIQGIPAVIAGSVKSVISGDSGVRGGPGSQLMEEIGYNPETEAGQALMEPIGEFINRVGIPMMGHGRVGPIPPAAPALMKSPRLSKAAEAFDRVEPKMDEVVPETAPPVEAPPVDMLKAVREVVEEVPREEKPAEVPPPSAYEGMNKDIQTLNELPAGEQTKIDNIAQLPLFKRNQQGGIDVQAFTEAIDKFFNKPAPLPVTRREFMAKQPGMGSDLEGAIPRGPKAEALVELAKNDPDLPPNFWQNVQSGMTLTADKVQSALLLGTSRWLQYAQKRGDFDFRQHVQPLEKAITTLSKDQAILLQEGLKRQQIRGERYSPEQLKQTGMSEEAIKAYEAINKQFDVVYEKQNAAREALGKEPITRQNAYYSSMWNGDWKVYVPGAKGRPAWWIETYSKKEAEAALTYLKKTVPELKNTKLKPKYQPGKTDIPKDILGAYQDMLQFFTDDPALTAAVKEAMENYAKEKGYHAFGQDVHFKDKHGVRGYRGDQPWLSDKKNAYEGLKAQMDYLRQAYKWTPMQEALAEIKKVMSDPVLAEKQPNTVEFAKSHVARELGLDPNLINNLEKGVAHLLGTSKAKLYMTTNDLKSLMYLQQLGLSGGYMVATPLQGLISVPAWHLKLSGEGLRLNPARAVKAYGLGITDATAILTEHYSNIYRDIAGAKSGQVPMTKFGREAMKYAEDNGIISKNLFDENSKIGTHGVISALENTVGSTISFPEKVVRTFAFMSFAHHLKETGKFPDKVSLFQRAEELTNNALTDFRQSERPLVVDKLGTAGQLAYTYHSFLFNMFNQMSTFIKQKNYVALTGMLATMVYLGGLMDLPFMNELDGMWNIFKNFIAEKLPQHYQKVEGPGLKGSIISMKDQGLAWGHVSTALGWQMSSRFSPNLLDIDRPLESILPMAKTVENAIPEGIPQSMRDLVQYGYNNAPAMVKGNMENFMPQFQGPKRGDDKQGVIKPTDINSGEVRVFRDKEDRTARTWGVTSLKEADSKAKDYIRRQEDKRKDTAKSSSLNKLYSSVLNKNSGDIKTYAASYYKLGGTDEGLQKFLSNKIEKSGMTLNEWLVAHGTSLNRIMEIKERRELGNAR
jgi:hypothetical protein